ncbi:MAG: cephalosporin hydroxylase family protein [Nanoarchaeota archaeon]|nr:cephalosporin hydroxylase family protein [Nanoarchaeota archaeon]
MSQEITYKQGEETRTVDIYTKEGLETMSMLWSKVFVHNKFTHEVTWMGIPIIQFPGDIVMMQELVWKIKPDVIVECGIAHGGSLIFYASLLELIGNGKVVGIDIDIRKHNRKAIESHPMFKRVEMIEGSSIDEDIVAQVKEKIGDAKTVLVILDSNHSKDHVAKEIQLYKGMVTPGSYLVVTDGAQKFMSDIPDGKPEWTKDNPWDALNEFMQDNDEFDIDPFYNRLKITSNPDGFLKKKEK